MIDGGIICNNPSLYAYIAAHIFKKKKNVRILSIGTGNEASEISDKMEYNKFDTIGMTSKFLTTFEQIAAEKILDKTLNVNAPGSFIRL